MPWTSINITYNYRDDMAATLGNVMCFRCGEGFQVNEQIVNSGGEIWHQECFVLVFGKFSGY